MNKTQESKETKPKSKRQVITFTRFLILTLTCLIIFIAPQLLLTANYQSRIYGNINDIPSKQYAIVFGAKVNDDYSLSEVVRERISAAVLLYKNEKVKKLFISGDNSHNREVESIAKYAIEQGVPEADIISDNLGIDTNDTCRHFRAISQEAILVTQSFHLPRAMYMCQKSNINGTGLAVNKLGLLSSRGDNAWQIYSIRIFRFFRESLLSWSFILGFSDYFSNEAELQELNKQ